MQAYLQQAVAMVPLVEQPQQQQPHKQEAKQAAQDGSGQPATDAMDVDHHHQQQQDGKTEASPAEVAASLAQQHEQFMRNLQALGSS